MLMLMLAVRQGQRTGKRKKEDETEKGQTKKQRRK